MINPSLESIMTCLVKILNFVRNYFFFEEKQEGQAPTAKAFQS
jgi:hypothetical protein